jgi:hypothetical protein
VRFTEEAEAHAAKDDDSSHRVRASFKGLVKVARYLPAHRRVGCEPGSCHRSGCASVGVPQPCLSAYLRASPAAWLAALALNPITQQRVLRLHSNASSGGGGGGGGFQRHELGAANFMTCTVNPTPLQSNASSGEGSFHRRELDAAKPLC